MGKANTEVSYPGTTGGDVCLSKRHIKLHHSLALWELTPKEFIIRVKEEHVVCPSRQMNGYWVSGVEALK